MGNIIPDFENQRGAKSLHPIMYGIKIKEPKCTQVLLGCMASLSTTASVQYVHCEPKCTQVLVGCLASLSTTASVQHVQCEPKCAQVLVGCLASLSTEMNSFRYKKKLCFLIQDLESIH